MVKSIYKIEKFYGFDVENDGDRLTVGSIYGDDRQYSFYSVEEFWQNLEEYAGTTLFATNLEYDLGILLNNREEEKSIRMIRRGGRLIFATYRFKSNKTIMFADTMNYTPSSVEKLGKMIGIPKLKQPSFSPKTDHEWHLLKVYNMNDSRISYEFMKYLQKGLGELSSELRITASSTALYTWNKNFCKMKLKPSKYAKQEMESYYGGRTEAFKRGLIEDIKVYDFNSMYPFVMATNEFPDPATARKCVDKKLEFEGISKVRVIAPKGLKIPLLPKRQDGKLLFPTGHWTGTYCHPELRKARELGYKVKVLSSIVYETRPMFKDYIESFYNLRLNYKRENNEIMQLLCKLFMNSLYGKFAIKNECEEEKHVSNIHPDDLIELLEEGNSITNNGFIHFKKQMDREPRYRMPIISSYITSYARLLLYRAMEEAGLENVAYCDTDSIFTTTTLKTGDKLGELDLEFEGAALIVRPKCYYLNNEEYSKVKVKGLGRVIKDKGMFDDYILQSKRIDFKRFAKIRESRRRGFWYGQPIDCFKTIDLEDTKRQWANVFNKDECQESKPINIV